jgi:hypothetical protein
MELGVLADSEILWQRVHSAFEAHRAATDADAQAALERIAVKCLGLPQRLPFDAHTCAVREAQLWPHDLLGLKVYHQRAQPLRSAGTIVLILYAGRLVVLDGNNRVNAWRSKNAGGPFDAIILEPYSGA